MIMASLPKTRIIVLSACVTSEHVAQLNVTGTARIAKHGYVYIGLSDEASAFAHRTILPYR
jgi:hypothetical protein